MSLKYRLLITTGVIAYFAACAIYPILIAPLLLGGFFLIVFCIVSMLFA